MSSFVIPGFSGMAPRVGDAYLQDSQATKAVNCNLSSNELRALRGLLPIGPGTAALKAGNIQTIYRFGQNQPDDNSYWFHWLTDVEVARSAVSGDTNEITCYTGDVEPRVTWDVPALTGPGAQYPYGYLTLGVPKPTLIPVATAGAGGSGDTLTRSWVVTYIQQVGAVLQEGKPSTPTANLAVKDGQTVTLTNLGTAGPTGNYNVLAKRIYRVQTGTTGGRYQLVAEIPVTQNSYVDTLVYSQIPGDVLPSTSYDMPPATTRGDPYTMRGIIALPTGGMAGFAGQDLCLSDAYLYHSWPVRYRLSTAYPIVAIGSYGSTIVVATTGLLQLAVGNDPQSYSMEQTELRQACVSKRSLTNINGVGVAYASPDGIVMVGPGGAAVATAEIMTRSEWETFNPASISAYQWQGRYVGFYNNGTPGGFIFDPQTRNFSLLDFYATAGYFDPKSGDLYLMVGGNLVEFDGDAAHPLRYDWTSKEFYRVRPMNPGFLKVEATDYPVYVNVFADSALVATRRVENSRLVRMPSGYQASKFRIQVVGTNGVQMVMLAETSDDFQGGR